MDVRQKEASLMNGSAIMQWLAGSLPQKTGRFSLTATRHVRHAITLCHALLSERGEASGANLAREVVEAYVSLNEEEVEAFFDSLIHLFSPDPDIVTRIAETYRAEPSQSNLLALQHAVEPPRQELFRRINMAPNGTAILVEMRRRVLRGLKQHPQWQGIDGDLEHLLRSWFNRGFLRLQRIDWNTSALILEKLTKYEAVHEIQGWRDLRRRLDADRRCYAYFHPALPDEPVIFIEIALARGLSAHVQPLLDPDSPVFDPGRADHAIFYSITNCQEGLRGISFGNFLIKQVAQDLSLEFPKLKRFATLSPAPGFRRWLEAQASDPANGRISELLAELAMPNWHRNQEVADKLREPLTRYCAYYFLHAKSGQEPLDPVARFHLSNGARLERINWLGDTSETGMARSAGFMVNYVYKLAKVEDNHEAYVKEGKIAVSSHVEALAKEKPG
jgi:malonyl-CoA decarboxylase